MQAARQTSGALIGKAVHVHVAVHDHDHVDVDVDGDGAVRSAEQVPTP